MHFTSIITIYDHYNQRREITQLKIKKNEILEVLNVLLTLHEKLSGLVLSVYSFMKGLKILYRDYSAVPETCSNCVQET